MKRILITGGAGFIGSHLCERLVNDGQNILCIDNLQSGKYLNIENLLPHPNFEFIEHDIVTPFFTDYDISQIYNLACPASPVQYQNKPIKTVKTNVLGTINMLGLARKKGARILQASTSEVYGDPQVHPQAEGYWGHVNPIGKRACYDEGKRAAETLFFDYHREHGLDIKVVRIFNTYGPKMCPNDGRVVSNFINQALQGEDITIYGDGSQTRSFCYVSDMVDGIIRMMNSRDNFTGPVNLGNPGEFTIAQLSEMVLRMTKSNSKAIYKPLPDDDPVKRKPEITLANKELSWSPKIPLNKGLESTIKYYRNEKTIDKSSGK